MFQINRIVLALSPLGCDVTEQEQIVSRTSQKQRPAAFRIVHVVLLRWHKFSSHSFKTCFDELPRLYQLDLPSGQT